LLDLAAYLLHRGQHAVGWWWQLHALHHAQTRMTFWTDDRNHAIDVALGHVFLVAIALAIGVAPGQFVGLVLCARLIESLSHANARLSFAWLGERALVSPRYHRRHHAIAESGVARGVNFAVLFPVWDMLFGTADFSRDYPPTGIAQEPATTPYPVGLLAQQGVGFRRIAASLIKPYRAIARP
jgi:sterol desaturase/sphingolipid hydroxylase (fatty acid hydroxylase superfamily)